MDFNSSIQSEAGIISFLFYSPITSFLNLYGTAFDSKVCYVKGPWLRVQVTHLGITTIQYLSSLMLLKIGTVINSKTHDTTSEQYHYYYIKMCFPNIIIIYSVKIMVYVSFFSFLTIR